MIRQPRSMPALGAIAAAAVLMSFGSAHAVATKPAFGVWSKVGTGPLLTGVTGGLLAPNGVAADVVVNLTGTPSFDALDAVGNTYLTLDVLPNALIDAISYSLTLATVGASWRSEAAVLFRNSAGAGVILTAGAGDDSSGTSSYADSVLLSDFGLSFSAGADGKLFLQFYETFDDVPNAADAFYTAGSVTFGNVGVVPEPATYGLMALGLFGVGALMRRRRG